MNLRIKKTFQYYFPTTFEMYITGIALLICSFPGVGLIFVHQDAILPDTFSGLRDFGIVWGCVTFAAAAGLLFGAVRKSTAPGSTAYRITHLNMSRWSK
jgi:hypothetical protein